MKKFNTKSFLMGLILGALVFSSIAVAFAASYTANLKATYRDIKVYVDDKQIGYTASNGAYAEPFIVDGTTYIPLRLFSEKLGQDVKWDGDTSSIYIGEHEQKTESMSQIKQKVYNYAITHEKYPDDEEYRYERTLSDIEVLRDESVACVLGIPVIAYDKYTGEDAGGAVDFYWYKKSTGEIKFVGGGQDWDDSWVNINTGEWTGPTYDYNEISFKEAVENIKQYANDNYMFLGGSHAVEEPHYNKAYISKDDPELFYIMIPFTSSYYPGDGSVQKEEGKALFCVYKVGGNVYFMEYQ